MAVVVKIESPLFALFLIILFIINMQNLKKILNFGESSLSSMAEKATAFNDNFITAIDESSPENENEFVYHSGQMLGRKGGRDAVENDYNEFL